MLRDKEVVDSFLGADGLRIFYRKLSSANESARLIIAHGLGEHSGRYQNIFNLLVPSDISVWALDFCGHGRSEGKRGHIDSFDQYILDLKKFISISNETVPENVKTFLLGHSLGGLIALNFAQRYAEMIHGVIASSPALGMTVKIPKIKVFMGKLMSAVWPSLAMGNELDPTKISHDEQVVKAYVEDPMVHDRVSARWFTEYLAAMGDTREQASEIGIPVLMQIAGDDHLVDPEASKDFFRQLTVRNKTLHVYDHLYHEIYNETGEQRTMVLSDLKDWLERMSRPGK